MTAFFLPGISPDEAEDLYAEAAEEFGVLPFPPGQRVQSSSFEHDGARWTATVGEELRGHLEVSRRSRGTRQGGSFGGNPLMRPVNDPATVSAGVRRAGLHLVLTDGGEGGTGTSRWENPFMVGHHAVQTVNRFED